SPKDFICLTGNPKTGVSNNEIINAIKLARNVLGEQGLIIAGKMHGAGVANETGDSIISTAALSAFIEAGADIILLPAPGTIPSMTVEKVANYVDFVHSKGALALLAIGTSQEGADEATIRQIALNSKMAGADIYHIGDTGYYGIAVPENIMAYSIAIRGRRHTYVRMAASINR
ncbi:haloacid dehalogenase-like hydrolase, partial [[Haemophilus] felis]|nr:haloacid dehalogenase-like hydrolase [[Haemophilus] felis]